MTVTAAPGLPQPCHEDPRLLTQQVPSTLDHEVIEARVARAITLDGGPQLPRELVGGLTRPRYYPPADHAVQWFADTWASASFSFLRAVVLHTTETSGWPGYGGGGSAPNFTAMPDSAGKRLVWRQHFGCDQSGRALLNLPGGVNTNTTNVVQIELVGTSAAGGPGMFWPDAPDWALADLAKFVRWLHDEWGVLPQASVTWKAYPGSYGTNNGVRLGGSDWLAYRGILAHEHVTENDHGDTGRFPIERLLAFATTPEDDMTAADVQAIKDHLDKNVLPAVKATVRDIVDERVRAYFEYPWAHNPVMAAPAGTVQPTTETNDKGQKWTAYRVSPLGMINEVFRKLTPTGAVMAALGQVAAQTDTVEGSLAAVKAAVADDPTLQQFVDALHAALGSGQGGQLTRADVEAALADVVARTHFVTATA
jgi:hypothetical protein